MDKQEINLTLTPDEINLVLESLGNLSFVRVFTLIGKIQSQAAAQLGNNAAASADGTDG